MMPKTKKSAVEKDSGIIDVDVDSSDLKHVHYERDAQILQITFNWGNAAYQYRGVPLHEVTDLLGADSIGRAFSMGIRLKYTGVKL